MHNYAMPSTFFHRGRRSSLPEVRLGCLSNISLLLYQPYMKLVAAAIPILTYTKNIVHQVLCRGAILPQEVRNVTKIIHIRHRHFGHQRVSAN